MDVLVASPSSSSPQSRLVGLTAGVIPLVLVAVFLLVAAVPRWTRREWSDILPWWIKILAYDVISDEDIQEERRDEQAHAQQQQQSQGVVASAESDGVDEQSTLIGHRKSHRHARGHSPSLKNFFLACIALLQLLGTIAALAFRIEASGATTFALTQVAQCIAWTYAVLRPLARKSPTPPYDLVVLYLVHSVACLVVIHAQWTQRASITPSIASLLVTSCALALIFSMPLTDVDPSPDTPEHTRPPAGEDRCTLWQWMTFSWMSPLIDLAVERTIEKENVWQLSEGCRSNLLVRKFKQVSSARSLPWRVIAANGHDILLDLLLTLASSTLSYAPPFFLKRILEAIEGNGSATTKSTAYLYAVLSLAAMIFKSQADLQHLFYGRRATVRIRGQLIASIYEKALRTRDMNGSLSGTKQAGEGDGNADDKPAKPSQGDSTAPSKAAATPTSSTNDDANIGKVVSLAAVDSIRIAAQCASAYLFYSAPIELVVASLFLYNLLGWSAFTGFLVLIVASPLQTRLTKRMIDISKHLSAARDKRLSALNELTQNLKFVKYYAFEEEMKRRILSYREIELGWLRKRQITQSFVMALWTLTPALVTTVSFASYVFIAKRALDVSTAFTAIALFQLLRGPLNNLPMQINELLNSKVASDRIDEFLKADEVPAQVSSIKSDATSQSPHIVEDPKVFGCQDATFKWPAGPVSDLTGGASSTKASRRGKQLPEKSLKKVVSRFFKRRLEDDEHDGQTASLHTNTPFNGNATPDVHDEDDDGGGGDAQADEDIADADEGPFQLHDITFMPPMGKISLVVGSTGSGKSALLTALLGEMEQLTGRSHMLKDARIDPKTGLSHTIAYCAQSPWLQHASIRQNILFGLPYEQKRYDAVLDACALRPDLEILDGDSTEIGEKGVSLSGGQQARVALARAVYSRASVLLLDDPLSAVDAHTAAKLVKDCLNGPLMKGRTTVLVTHHADLVLGARQAVAWVVKLDRGSIVAQGTPGDLIESGDVIASSSGKEAATRAEVDDDDDAVPGDEQANAEQHEPTAHDASAHAPRKLVEEEHRATGGVKREVYKMYLDAVGWWISGLVVLTLVAFKGTDLAEKGWLAVWGASYRQAPEAVVNTLQNNVSAAPATLPHANLVWLASGGAGVSGAAGLFDPWVFWAQDVFRRTIGAVGTSALSGPIHGSFALSATPDVSTRAASPFPPASVSPAPYILVFFLINVASASLIILSALFTFYGSLQASRTLFARMLVATMGATTRWLDKTPSGRIVNKFSRDVEVVDSSINNSLRYFVSFVIAAIVSVLTIIVVLPSFIVPTFVLGAMNYYVTRGYVRAARDLRRLESVSRSPIFSAFSELLQGISTVRAFAAEKRLLRECTDRIDLANSFFLYFWMSNRWLLFRLDVLGAFSIFIATVASLYGTIAAGLAGLALTQAQSLIQAGYWMARFYTTLEQDANSIERIREALDDVPQEAAGIIEDSRPPAAWPAKGKVEVRDLVLRYAPELPPVLHGISFSVQPGEKVGIVGRTGSGKSTTALAFFRFVEFDGGSIHIDDVDIGKIGLYDLRSRLTIIPQNAVLFSGTIRDNLDPFGQHSDEECLAALRRVNFRTAAAGGGGGGSASRTATGGTTTPVKRSGGAAAGDKHLQVPSSTSSNNGKRAQFSVSSGRDGVDSPPSASSSQSYVTLDSRVSEGGSNWSQGQRQLLAMARALLRNSQVILMDEASSAVDFATDSLIQSTIRSGFSQATVITIAHRLHTVAHADKVLVLDNGRVKEFDAPRALMSDETSAFHGMCKKSGDWDALWSAANANANASGGGQ